MSKNAWKNGVPPRAMLVKSHQKLLQENNNFTLRCNFCSASYLTYVPTSAYAREIVALGSDFETTTFI